jgi:hypothetical protein
MGKKCTEFLLVNLMESNHMEELCIDEVLKKYDGRAWTGFVWLRIGMSGCVL